jgi:hypothetical protein
MENVPLRRRGLINYLRFIFSSSTVFCVIYHIPPKSQCPEQRQLQRYTFRTLSFALRYVISCKTQNKNLWGKDTYRLWIDPKVDKLELWFYTQQVSSSIPVKGNFSWFIFFLGIHIIKANEMHYFSNLFWYWTLHVSDRFTVYHQDCSSVYTAIRICHTGYADCLLARSSRSR